VIRRHAAAVSYGPAVAASYGPAAAVSYLAALVVGTAFTHVLPAAARSVWIGWVSTSVANLADHPIPSLVLSCIVTEGDPLGWLAVGAVGLIGINRVLGNGRTLLLIAAVQTVGTLASEGLNEVRILLGQLPTSDRYLVDVGPSFVVVGALVATIAYGGRPARALSVVGFLIVLPSLFGGLPSLEVSSVGHLVSVVTALAMSELLRSVSLGGTPGHRRWFRLPARRRGPETVETPES
jgi:hypothetical protein